MTLIVYICCPLPTFTPHTHTSVPQIALPPAGLTLQHPTPFVTHHPPVQVWPLFWSPFFHSPTPPLFAASFFFCAHYTKKSLFIYSFLKLEQVSIEDPVPANIHPLSQQKQRLTQKGLEGEVLQVQDWEGGQADLRARIQAC